MVRRRGNIPKDEDYIKEKKEVVPMSTGRKVAWFIFAIGIIPLLFIVPSLLAMIGDWVQQHMPVFYGLWIVYGIILLYLKFFVLKNHNWDSFLSILCIAAIIGMGIYKFLRFEKHFPNGIKQLGFYMWLAVCMIPTIAFYLIDTTDYYKVLEHEQKMKEEEDRIAQKRHEKYVKRREKNPPFWMKTKTNKIICDTIVIVVFILICLIIAYYFIISYQQFSYRVRRGLDVNDYENYYDDDYLGEDFDPKNFIHDEDFQ
ncbi:hypothetical protein, conserved [Entamoeba dispar SAW760]|uniref:Uncharacterized protein n=1 Tax=Entamoeba dispar (strain ATCC PRA-260 / SAW760) TaxID=370354 RepID=B0EKL3_ENTDS|nr:uncharacterized protein EDI_038420 [Entamoeba dispar SAW760]EDR24938.1 hypothetical protein, conserved [Entamoeba dispar SAW760]|eukprot:EDR24938.1 hypothetical protein, conserved [Entamoeba dispar SAW760]